MNSFFQLVAKTATGAIKRLDTTAAVKAAQKAVITSDVAQVAKDVKSDNPEAVAGSFGKVAGGAAAAAGIAAVAGVFAPASLTFIIASAVAEVICVQGGESIGRKVLTKPVRLATRLIHGRKKTPDEVQPQNPPATSTKPATTQPAWF